MYITTAPGIEKYMSKKHNLHAFAKALSAKLCANDCWKVTNDRLLADKHHHARFGVNVSAKVAVASATLVNVSAQLTAAAITKDTHSKLMTYHQYNVLLYKLGYQCDCVICKMTCTSYFCTTCGTDVPVHNPEGRTKYKKCKGMHMENPSCCAVKRGQC